MGLLQKAVETYDSHKSLVGKYIDGKAVLAPIAHTVKKTDIEITIDADGVFWEASASDQSEGIIIPASVESAGRAGKVIAPHPLADQLCYLSAAFPDKYQVYVKQLTEWADSEYTHPKLKPILTYIQNGTIYADLERSGLIKLNAKGIPNDEKLMIRWRVIGLEDGQDECCWKDEKLFKSYREYYCSIQEQEMPMVCMVDGSYAQPAKQHAKGVVSLAGNAKLISANDKSGFTYRGRFTQEWQAMSVSYEASQKSHNALRWLVDTQGVIFGGRTFLCWNPQGRYIVPATMPFLRPPKPIFRPTEYREALKKTLEGRRAELEPADGVVIAAFDAATTGRLSVTYYNELLGSDFLQRLHDWDTHCCWNDWRFGIQSPPLWQIVNCAFGTQQTEKGVTKMKSDERVMRQQIQRLIACRVDRTAIGADIVKALVNRASTPVAYDETVRETILVTACAVIRKYRYDRYKEEWEMALEPERIDRSYQFGRLLAVMEKVERDTYDGGEGREPNAIRMQSVFCQRPMYAAGILEKQLERAYFPRLGPGSRVWYKNLIGQILEKISAFPQETWNTPLEDSYLMGYYLQRSAMYTKKNNDDMEEE